MKGYLVIIPYLASEAQGRELELAVRGWHQHFREQHRIVIVGDMPRFDMPPGYAEYIPCPRIPDTPGQYRPHLDIINKIDVALHDYPEYDGFIYTCDDIYAVNDFGIEEVLFPKVQDWVIPVIADDEGNGWWKDLGKTRAVCEKSGYAMHNWVCHLPVYYDRKRYMEILDRHDCRNTSYVVENLYFNAYYAKRMPLVLSKGNNLKYPIQSKFNPAEFEAALATKIWVYNSVGGWCKELEEMLLNHYGCSTDYPTKDRSQR